MNILFFLTPKNEVAFVWEDDSLRQVMEKMEYHRYSAIPIINKNGKYIGTITEGDLLWDIKNQYHLSLKDSEQIPITDIHRHMNNAPVRVTANMEDLVEKALNQNFVPVIDDDGSFIGIITRKDIIQYFYTKLKERAK